ncbi:MAG: hypothetical protein QF511_13070 [Rhodospirillales bacterium]|jgi:hypothetical protein|nr:hypothetical protein [Rhodospirillales bacterium]HIJ44003.1 hypothetical protein [Rhodospirillaceae bacterium]MDP7099408.1 hypothetical protein [Rhodospirillales bacterium]MDP7216009.1 hypothetical protein [Rhodospirillales bacterium]HIJ92480.1 hypothetical protein [Rhodospirillaceae bacterium]
MGGSVLLGIAGLALFALLAFRLLRPGPKVQARDIRNSIVAGDVNGDVNLQAASPPPAGKPSLTDRLTLANAVIGIIAGVLVIFGFFLGLK